MDKQVKPGKILARVAETFFSIQGEGSEQGTPMYFIRLSGCSVTECALHPANSGLCDTNWNFRELRTCDDLVQSIPVGVHWVCITGGEPMEQTVAVEEITRLAHRSKKRVMLQTSGKFPVSDIFDWLVVSPKQSIDAIRQTSGHELKLLYNGQTIGELKEWHQKTKFHRYYLMPIWENGCNWDGVVCAVKEACEHGLPWRVAVQSQKYMQVR